MAKLFYIPSHSLQQRTDKIPASGKSFKRATNKSILTVGMLNKKNSGKPWRCNPKLLELQSTATYMHACIHTYLNSLISDCVGSMGENKSIIKIEEDCLHFFYQMARTHSPMWLRSLRSPPKSQVSQAWEKVLLLLP
jgi:glutamate/tyrosine decarboxylase-like PLP-dependent enzyme